MSSLGDFIRSATSDTVLPVFQQTLEDVVMEVLSDRQVPSRTDFHELRDLVNKMRGTVSATSNAIQKLENRIGALEARISAMEGSKKKKASAARKRKTPAKG